MNADAGKVVTGFFIQVSALALRVNLVYKYKTVILTTT